MDDFLVERMTAVAKAEERITLRERAVAKREQNVAAMGR